MSSFLWLQLATEFPEAALFQPLVLPIILLVAYKEDLKESCVPGFFVVFGSTPLPLQVKYALASIMYKSKRNSKRKGKEDALYSWRKEEANAFVIFSWNLLQNMISGIISSNLPPFLSKFCIQCVESCWRPYSAGVLHSVCVYVTRFKT